MVLRKISDQDVSKMKFRELLEELDQLEEVIATDVKNVYERREAVIAKCVDAFISRLNRKAEKISGLVTSVHEIKFRDGARFQLIPIYMRKDGSFNNTLWKAAGAQVFSIKKILPQKEKSK